eukprot:Clim_evm36s207 gene=Clim_evmTU36s207
MEQYKEIAGFLSSDRIDVSMQAIQICLSVTGDRDVTVALASLPDFWLGLNKCIRQPEIVGNAAVQLTVNVTAHDDGAIFEQVPKYFIRTLADTLKNKAHMVDYTAMALNNITRSPITLRKCVAEDENIAEVVDLFIDTVATAGVNDKKEQRAKYLLPAIANMAQEGGVRKALLADDAKQLKKIMTFSRHEDDFIRQAVFMILKNLGMDYECVENMFQGMGDDLFLALMMPLAGPEDEFRDDEMEGLPEDLQFLEDDKKREPNPEIRLTILEAIFALCGTRQGRDYMRSRQCYPLLREYHKTEDNADCDEKVTDVIHILLSVEGDENLHTLEIPEKYQKSFDEQRAKMAANRPALEGGPAKEEADAAGEADAAKETEKKAEAEAESLD